MVKVLLVILCLFLPFLAVLIHDGPSKKVLWALLLQLLGHIPGVIYGHGRATAEPAWVQWLPALNAFLIYQAL